MIKKNIVLYMAAISMLTTLLSKPAFAADAQPNVVAAPPATVTDDTKDNQYVTLGVAAIWLDGIAQIVPAPMIRIFLNPKSYAKTRQDLFSLEAFNTTKWWYGMIERFDVNFGYTASSAKIDDEKTNFVLTGLSFELNKAALLNFGVAHAVNDVKHEKRQAYVGITVDYNILKDLGVVK